ncbi:MAG TPA: hypothetical protein VLE02_03010 [Nitrosarchaeum sp.]|nr:hypothetical protein [Nitrosarchaeum sp.]
MFRKQISLFVAIAAISVTGGMLAFDQIQAKEVFDENTTAVISFSVMPIEQQIIVKSGQTVPIEFKVMSQKDVDLKIDIEQLDERARSLSLESIIPSSDLSVDINTEHVSFRNISEHTEELISGTVTVSKDMKPGTYQMGINALDESSGHKWTGGFQIIVQN